MGDGHQYHNYREDSVHYWKTMYYDCYHELGDTIHFYEERIKELKASEAEKMKTRVAERLGDLANLLTQELETNWNKHE